ncbi:MAG: hypothetical protein GY861_14385 [bacterium]|nr:hypothetical protein [bacterium]
MVYGIKVKNTNSETQIDNEATRNWIHNPTEVGTLSVTTATYPSYNNTVTGVLDTSYGDAAFLGIQLSSTYWYQLSGYTDTTAYVSTTNNVTISIPYAKFYNSHEIPEEGAIQLFHDEEATDLLTVSGGDIYKQVRGIGDFVLRDDTTLVYRIVSTSSGDIYTGHSGGVLKKQTSGVGSFVTESGLSSLDYIAGLQVRANGDIYVFGHTSTYGDIWVKSGGEGSWVREEKTMPMDERYVRGGCIAPNGDIYITGRSRFDSGLGQYVYDIWKQTGGTGSFVSQSLEDMTQYTGLFAVNSGDIFALHGQTLLRQTGGTGSFVDSGFVTRSWKSVRDDDKGNIILTAPPHYIYRQNGGTGTPFAISDIGNWYDTCMYPYTDYGCMYNSDLTFAEVLSYQTFSNPLTGNPPFSYVDKTVVDADNSYFVLRGYGVGHHQFTDPGQSRYYGIMMKKIDSTTVRINPQLYSDYYQDQGGSNTHDNWTTPELQLLEIGLSGT